MDIRCLRSSAPIFILFLIAAGNAAAQGYPGYPYTIMAPERGAASHHRTEALKRMPHSRTARLRRIPLSRRYYAHGSIVARGSSGSVLPAPLPRTELIPPEHGGISTAHALPQAQGPTIAPGLNPIPNLPHGTETFQDRALRCSFQQGLYNVPGTASTQYMAACLQ